MGVVAKDVLGIAYTGSADLANLNWGGVFYNISAATLGNIVGGAVFIGLLYWIAYRKKEA
jgi:formate/nitrite transporter FocA (FNT family)